jgi:nucleotide-binding universal stress UspA family protein
LRSRAGKAEGKIAQDRPRLEEISMTTALKAGWSKPSTILFASEIPANEKAFAFALAQAVEFGAKLILFHAFDSMTIAASTLAADEMESLPVRVQSAGVECEVVVRPGMAAEQILAYTRKCKVDRIVMGTHSPGPIGKLLVGSVAEAVLRSSVTPVCVIGPEVVDGRYRNFATRTILCGVSQHTCSQQVVQFAAELAAEQDARLILQSVIRPQERAEILAGRNRGAIEAEQLLLIPAEHRGKFPVQSMVVEGDPTEELLYQSLAQQADMIVLGAQGASAFAAATRQGVVYKVLAHAQCPVMTLSPVVLAACGVKEEMAHAPAEAFLAGVF